MVIEMAAMEATECKLQVKNKKNKHLHHPDLVRGQDLVPGLTLDEIQQDGAPHTVALGRCIGLLPNRSTMSPPEVVG